MSHHRYFTNFDDFMKFFFINYERSKMIEFCPGACFLVERERITQHPRAFYLCLRRMLEYEFFPSEAWMVERSLNMIFTGDLEVRDFLNDEATSIKLLDALPDKTNDFIAMAGPLKPLKEQCVHVWRKLHQQIQKRETSKVSRLKRL